MSNIKQVAMITVCGRPNVGKSSLTNALVGEKVAIVSNKAQTTRNRIYGVVNREDTQYILLDTPGLHKPKSALGEYMVKVVTSSLSDVDCALLLVEPIAHVGAPELALIERIREEKIPCILCINKIDTLEPSALLPVIAAYNQAWDGFEAIIPISAHTGSGLDELLGELHRYAQEGPQLFPDGQTSDQPERQVMGEIIREKLLLCLDKEIPHGTAVEITKFSERESGMVDVDAVIYCEKASHKGIIIGKQGAMLKKVSTLARQDMEKFMGTKVYLETWVKVKENWRDNVNYVRNFGYHELDSGDCRCQRGGHVHRAGYHYQQVSDSADLHPPDGRSGLCHGCHCCHAGVHPCPHPSGRSHRYGPCALWPAVLSADHGRSDYPARGNDLVCHLQCLGYQLLQNLPGCASLCLCCHGNYYCPGLSAPGSHAVAQRFCIRRGIHVFRNCYSGAL